MLKRIDQRRIESRRDETRTRDRLVADEGGGPARRWHDGSMSLDPARARPTRAEPGANPVGLRGLATRAPFAVGMCSDALWPESELDRFAELLDDAARHEGVAPEDGP